MAKTSSAFVAVAATVAGLTAAKFVLSITSEVGNRR